MSLGYNLSNKKTADILVVFTDNLNRMTSNCQSQYPGFCFVYTVICDKKCVQKIVNSSTYVHDNVSLLVEFRCELLCSLHHSLDHYCRQTSEEPAQNINRARLGPRCSYEL